MGPSSPIIFTSETSSSDLLERDLMDKDILDKSSGWCLKFEAYSCVSTISLHVKQDIKSVKGGEKTVVQ